VITELNDRVIQHGTRSTARGAARGGGGGRAQEDERDAGRAGGRAGECADHGSGFGEAAAGGWCGGEGAMTRRPGCFALAGENACPTTASAVSAVVGQAFSPAKSHASFMICCLLWCFNRVSLDGASH